MRRMTLALVGGLIASGALIGSLASSAQTTDPGADFAGRFSAVGTTARTDVPAVRVFERFGGERPLAALAETARIVGRDVIVNGGRRVEFNTGNSHFIVSLTGGELTTVEAGREVDREEGDRWAIAPGTNVLFTTGDDSATLDMLEITPAPR